LSLDLNKMTLVELQSHKVAVDAAIQKRKETDRQDAVAKLKAVAAEAGYSLEELMRGSRRSSSKFDKRSSVEAKYAHPENNSLTWTGRGKTPKWVLELESSGKGRDTLLIHKS
jgi:DNA-binding protein H-NS